MTRIVLADPSRCVGCAACALICPTHSITMKEDKEGFLQPKIDKRTCVKCHKCEKTCPILNKETAQSGVETKAYAIINKDETIRAKSSSGGVFHTLAKWVIEHGGVVFGAKYDERWEVVHDYAETMEGVGAFMGSKYVQSRIGETYKQAKAFLENGSWVLFSGTPCQLGGLRAFLGKEYDRLIQVDLVCHGVPSPAVWRGYLNDHVTEGEIVSVNFRDKNNGWLRRQSITTTTTTALIREQWNDNPFFRGFLRNVYLRKSCYDCKYRTYHRNSDITLGDYWGVDELCPVMFDDKGTSIVFVHSDKGRQLIAEANNELRIIEQTKGSATKFNPNMDRENPKELKRERYFRIFRMTSFKRAVHVIDKDTFFRRVLRRVKKIFICNYGK